MSRESRLQTAIKKELKSLGCDVLIIRPQPGIPDGWEDIMFIKEGFWGCLETKKDPKAPYRPLQKERIEKHNRWSYSKRVDPTDWHIIRDELREMLA